ncbi:MAG: hypothetical protein JNN28_04050 [Saprospiraceae bacterium]|nr:hypothetical protein [Saprospiraceae bacterium]
MNTFCFKITGVLLVSCLLGGFTQAQGVLQTGTVKFTITTKAAKDTGIQTIYFKPGFGVVEMLNPTDSSGFQSIYAFEKDSVYHFLRGDELMALPAMGIQELMAQSKLKTSFKVTTGKKHRNILGYDCFDFKAETGSGKSKTVITGWATRQIQHEIGVVMDQDLLAIGFPMEFFMMPNGGSKKKAVVFSAVQVTPTVDERIFIHPK